MRNILLINLLEKYPNYKEHIKDRLNNKEWLLSHWQDNNGDKVNLVPLYGMFYQETKLPYIGSLLGLKPIYMTNYEIEQLLTIEIKEFEKKNEKDSK